MLCGGTIHDLTHFTRMAHTHRAQHSALSAHLLCGSAPRPLTGAQVCVRAADSALAPAAACASAPGCAAARLCMAVRANGSIPLV